MGEALPVTRPRDRLFLPSPRPAPFSHNAKKEVVDRITKGPPTTSFLHYAKRPALRSTRRGLRGPAGPWSWRRWSIPVFVMRWAPPSSFGSQSHAVGAGWRDGGACRKKFHHGSPTRPLRALGIRFALPSLPAPPQTCGASRPCTPPHRREKLASAGSKNSRPAVRFFGRQGQIVTKRFGNFFCHRRGKGRGNFRDLSLICHKGLFRPLISIFLGTLNPLFIRGVRPPGLEPGTN